MGTNIPVGVYGQPYLANIESAESCANHCLSEDRCFSFDYSDISQRCYLGSGTDGDDGSLSDGPPGFAYRYYERTSSTSKIGCMISTSLQQRALVGFLHPREGASFEDDGLLLSIISQHTRIVSAAECAMLCITAGVLCVSFDFAPAIHYCYLLSQTARSAEHFDWDTIGYHYYERRVVPIDWSVRAGLQPLPPLVVPFGALLEFHTGSSAGAVHANPFGNLDTRLVLRLHNGDHGDDCDPFAAQTVLDTCGSGCALYGVTESAVHHFGGDGLLCYIGLRVKVSVG